jgi:hypothetical protein
LTLFDEIGLGHFSPSFVAAELSFIDEINGVGLQVGSNLPPFTFRFNLFFLATFVPFLESLF